MGAVAGLGCCLALAGVASAGPAPNERIVGGDVADPADWPFIAELVTKQDAHICGASVIARKTVVTAAHCVEGWRRGSFRIVTGRPDRDEPLNGQRFRLAEMTIHPEYLRRWRHDIAILRLSRPTDAPAALLPTAQEDAAATAPGSELRVAGWGGTERDGGNPSEVLLDVSLWAISDEDCDPHFPYFHAEEEVCAFGAPKGDRYDDSCYGDSGGPLVADTQRGALLVGLVSYGGPRCGVEKPGVYTQVADNLGFIARKARLP